MRSGRSSGVFDGPRGAGVGEPRHCPCAAGRAEAASRECARPGPASDSCASRRRRVQAAEGNGRGTPRGTFRQVPGSRHVAASPKPVSVGARVQEGAQAGGVAVTRVGVTLLGACLAAACASGADRGGLTKLNSRLGSAASSRSQYLPSFFVPFVLFGATHSLLPRMAAGPRSPSGGSHEAPACLFKSLQRRASGGAAVAVLAFVKKGKSFVLKLIRIRLSAVFKRTLLPSGFVKPVSQGKYILVTW